MLMRNKDETLDAKMMDRSNGETEADLERPLDSRCNNSDVPDES